MSDQPTLGFIGTGMLGQPMAVNLLQAGYPLKVYNRSREKLTPLLELGATAVDQPWEAAASGGIVISLVADDTAVETIIGDQGELPNRLGPGGIHISMSTIAPPTSQRLAEQQAKLGGYYLAAPVMGRPDAVAGQKQAYFISGDPSAKARVTPILEAISAGVFDYGEDPAAANVAKLAANFLIASAIEAMGEAFTFMTKHNGDPQTLLTAITSTFLACPLYKNYGQQIVDGRYEEALFKLSLGHKDMRLLDQSAQASQTPMRFASVLQDRFLAAMAHGLADYDWTGITAEIESEAGL